MASTHLLTSLTSTQRACSPQAGTWQRGLGWSDVGGCADMRGGRVAEARPRLFLRLHAAAMEGTGCQVSAAKFRHVSHNTLFT